MNVYHSFEKKYDWQKKYEPVKKKEKEQRVENKEDLKLRKEYKLLLDMLTSELDILFKASVAHLKALYGAENIIVNKDQHYIFAKGTKPEICLVAHLDTVAEQHKPIPVINEGVVYTNNTKGCLGADDRAGAYGILRIIKNGHRPSILFTTGEETGCIGVRQFNTDQKDSDLLKDTRLFIEMDRKGFKDCIDYSNRNPDEVTEYFKQFGFEGGSGSVSDVKWLTKQFEIPHANLSIGYYNQHSHEETLNLEEMENTILQVENMVKNPIKERYKLKPEKIYTPPKSLNSYTQNGFGYARSYLDDYERFDDTEFLEELPEGLKTTIDLEDALIFLENTDTCEQLQVDTVFLDANGAPFILEIYVDKNGMTIDQGFRVYTIELEKSRINKKVFDEQIGNLYEEYLIEKESEEQLKSLEAMSDITF